MEILSTFSIESENIFIPFSIINEMELRVESAFRSEKQDVELVYALSGGDIIIDQLHNLSSSKE